METKIGLARANHAFFAIQKLAMAMIFLSIFLCVQLYWRAEPRSKKIFIQKKSSAELAEQKAAREEQERQDRELAIRLSKEPFIEDDRIEKEVKIENKS